MPTQVDVSLVAAILLPLSAAVAFMFRYITSQHKMEIARLEKRIDNYEKELIEIQNKLVAVYENALARRNGASARERGR